MTNIQVATESVADKITDLNNIAISFSGGGYRASAFHLGSLDLLDKVGLRENVTMLSTVCGGSITGGIYDNFGTDSLFVADRRFKKKGKPEHQFDTFKFCCSMVYLFFAVMRCDLFFLKYA